MYTEIIVRVSDPYDSVDPNKILATLHQVLGFHVVPDELGRLVRVIGHDSL
jgi:hypothetical protein